jgi:hypothetical protein
LFAHSHPPAGASEATKRREIGEGSVFAKASTRLKKRDFGKFEDAEFGIENFRGRLYNLGKRCVGNSSSVAQGKKMRVGLFGQVGRVGQEK